MIETLSEFQGLPTTQEHYVSNWGRTPMDMILSQLALLDDHNNDRTGFHGNDIELIIDTHTMLHSLGLYHDGCDGISLTERLVGNVEGSEFGFARKLVLLKKYIEVAEYNVRTFDLPQYKEDIIKTLAMIIDRQFEREGIGCPLSVDLARKVANLRPEYLSEATHRKLDMHLLNRWALGEY